MRTIANPRANISEYLLRGSIAITNWWDAVPSALVGISLWGGEFGRILLGDCRPMLGLLGGTLAVIGSYHEDDFERGSSRLIRNIGVGILANSFSRYQSGAWVDNPLVEASLAVIGLGATIYGEHRRHR